MPATAACRAQCNLPATDQRKSPRYPAQMSPISRHPDVPVRCWEALILAGGWPLGELLHPARHFMAGAVVDVGLVEIMRAPGSGGSRDGGRGWRLPRDGRGRGTRAARRRGRWSWRGFAGAEVSCVAGMGPARNLEPDAVACFEAVGGGPQLDPDLTCSVLLLLAGVGSEGDECRRRRSSTYRPDRARRRGERRSRCPTGWSERKAQPWAGRPRRCRRTGDRWCR